MNIDRIDATDGLSIGEYRIDEKPYYQPVRNEVEAFERAWRLKLPVMLKGPTGCGKTRFLEYMSWKLSRPLITVACHEDLTASDLVGRYLLKGDETVWADGPLSLAVKLGGICYLDEVVEARKDTTVVIHPLTDTRRILPQEKRGRMLEAHPDFLLTISYNPGYQNVLKDLKHSTRQRFVSITFDYPPQPLEETIVAEESGIDKKSAKQLVHLGQMIRNLRDHGLEEGVSTRLLIYAAKLIADGLEPREACEFAITRTMSDDREMNRAISEIAMEIF